MNSYIVEEYVKACESYNTRHEFLQKYPLDDRVSRLFAVACCREIWNKLPNESSKKAVEVAEIYADGLATKEDLQQARIDVWNAADDDAYAVRWSASTFASSASSVSDANAAYAAYWSAFTADQYKRQGLILAQMYPVDFNTQWITPNTTALAHNIYNNKDFSLMPILADALQDVDCSEEISSHLRSKGPFYKGNYIIDVLTGKRQ